MKLSMKKTVVMSDAVVDKHLHQDEGCKIAKPAKTGIARLTR